MLRKDFYYELPEELIAQDPLKKRDSSRLMVLHTKSQRIEHRVFSDLPEYLREGDCIVLNESRVIPARLIGVREETGGRMELLLLKRLTDTTWESLVKPGKRARAGARFDFGEGILKAEVKEVLPTGNRVIEFFFDGIFEEVLDRLGEMPLPPYITHKLEDKERYQTVYAKQNGSAAAPTAGLHFTEELLQRIEGQGVDIARLVLHVGLGTFRPVKEDNIEDHPMHAEYYEVPSDAAEKIQKTKERGGRIVAIGTTSTRTLETVAEKYGSVRADSGWTDIFIYPGKDFHAIDALVTNFHLPESTLLMLVSALAGREFILRAYEEAVREKYRFFSFGDAMLILPD